MPTDVVIVSAARTPIATAYKGSLGGVDAFALAEVAIAEAVKRSGIPVDQIEDMGFGESFQGGGNIGRNVAVRLGMLNVPSMATQRWCASGMGAYPVDRRQHRGNDRRRTRGGTESMSTAPGTSKPGPDGAPVPWLSPGNPETPEAPPFNMALTVGDNTARIAGVTREEADNWAFESHRRAIRAIDEGRFDNEIVPVDLPGGGQFTVDASPPQLHAREAGVAGGVEPRRRRSGHHRSQPSGLNDAAAALVLCSRDHATAHGLEPLAVIRGWASAGVDPVETGLAPTKALPKAVAKAGISSPTCSRSRSMKPSPPWPSCPPASWVSITTS